MKIRLALIGTLAVGLSIFTAEAAKLRTRAAAPDFTLTDTHGDTHSLSDFKGSFVVLEWTNHGCPFVKKHYSEGNMQGLQKEFTEKDVIWLSICSSGEGKQGNMSNEEWNKTTEELGASPTAVLIDADGTVGRMYDARTTPHMFIIAPDGKLIYQGAIDDKRSTDPSDIRNSVNYVRLSLNRALAGEEIEKPQTQPYGCSVKYSPEKKIIKTETR